MNSKSTVRLALLAVVVATQVAVAGSSIFHPVPIARGDICHRCARVIEDRFVAGEVIANDGTTAYKFRTVRCMLTYLKGASEPYTKVLVADDRTGNLIDVDDAVFVPVAIDTFTGEPGYGIGDVDYIAFGSQRAGDRFASGRGVTTMSWAAVVYRASLLPVRADAP